MTRPVSLLIAGLAQRQDTRVL